MTTLIDTEYRRSQLPSRLTTLFAGHVRKSGVAVLAVLLVLVFAGLPAAATDSDVTNETTAEPQDDGLAETTDDQLDDQ
ncbi:hypothetical protein [Halostella pelagica]|uniref:hypothetical protein n=1 Tax=Halostella pelagica TaxID=2583824 RepID=UPI001080B9CF|nr:hypothetical protein [Halostella pelagica]